MTSAQYPVYIISKGRADQCLTARFMRRDGQPFKLVVEPQEAELYAKEFGMEQLSVLPFSNLGLGGIPARNWVWEDALKAGHKRHWIFDDNIRCIYRRWKARKIRCATGPALAASEAFVDRYENIAIAGLQYAMFTPSKRVFMPFVPNVHVYSCLLIRNDLPYRWRGRYNEDTDLCLQVLAGGWCTLLFNAFLIEKMATMTMKGGNSAELYKGDGRLKMARSLERAWPGVVETKRRFKRPQHVVNWKKFDTTLKRKEDVDFNKLVPNEFGMELKQVKETQNKTLQRLLKEAT